MSNKLIIPAVLVVLLGLMAFSVHDVFRVAKDARGFYIETDGNKLATLTGQPIGTLYGVELWVAKSVLRGELIIVQVDENAGLRAGDSVLVTCITVGAPGAETQRLTFAVPAEVGE